MITLRNNIYFFIKKTLPLLSTLVLFISCTVNNSTGLITISNKTSIKILTVKINENTLATLGQGSKTDYWFYSDFDGIITANEIKNIFISDSYNSEIGQNNYVKESECYFKTNYRYEIRISQISIGQYSYYTSTTDNYIFVEPGIKVGANKSDTDFYHYPGKKQ